MIQFNKKLQNYKPKNFGYIAIDPKRTKFRDDAYAVDLYDDEHFFIGVYISNNVYGHYKEYIVKHALQQQIEHFSKTFKQKNFQKASLSKEQKKKVFAFKFLVDSEGNLCDFAIDKEEIKLDYIITNVQAESICIADKDNLTDDEAKIQMLLNLMKTISDIIYINKSGEIRKPSDDICKDFTTIFYEQFNDMANEETVKLFEENNIPLLYECATYDPKENDYIIFYSSSYKANDIHKQSYGAFTSPIRKAPDAINLAILDDVVFNSDKGNKEQKKENWKKILKKVHLLREKNVYNENENKISR